MELSENYFKDSKVCIYHKPCDKLKEIQDKSIDIIITSPPYNIGHIYSDFTDNLTNREYISVISKFLSSSTKKIKQTGIIIIDIPDIIFHNGRPWFAADFIVKRQIQFGLNLIYSHAYIAQKNIDPFGPHSILNANSYPKQKKINDHSPIQLILAFSFLKSLKKELKFKDIYSYTSSSNEAFWPDELIKDFIKNFAIKNKVVLDPFMGSGILGLKIIENNCYFKGFEIVKEYIENFLNKINYA